MIAIMYNTFCYFDFGLRCLWTQATCVISYKRDQRGTVIDNSWEGKCLEPGNECPTSCQTDATFTTQTCYKCNVPATCEGQFSSLSLRGHKRTQSVQQHCGYNHWPARWHQRNISSTIKSNIFIFIHRKR